MPLFMIHTLVLEVLRFMATIKLKAGKKVLAGASVGIPPRQLNFEMHEIVKRYPVDNNATATLFMAMLSAFFPSGEKFFVESVRHYRERITDKKLKAAVSGFIGQEAIHGREHEKLNEFFNSRGIDTKFPEKTVNIGLWLLRRLSHQQQLACTTLMGY